MHGTMRIVLEAMVLVARLAAPVPLMEQGAISWFTASLASPAVAVGRVTVGIESLFVITGCCGR